MKNNVFTISSSLVRALAVLVLICSPGCSNQDPCEDIRQRCRDLQNEFRDDSSDLTPNQRQARMDTMKSLVSEGLACNPTDHVFREQAMGLCLNSSDATTRVEGLGHIHILDSLTRYERSDLPIYRCLMLIQSEQTEEAEAWFCEAHSRCLDRLGTDDPEELQDALWWLRGCVGNRWAWLDLKPHVEGPLSDSVLVYRERLFDDSAYEMGFYGLRTALNIHDRAFCGH